MAGFAVVAAVLAGAAAGATGMATGLIEITAGFAATDGLAGTAPEGLLCDVGALALDCCVAWDALFVF
jgi:hypothetical protein